MYHIPIAPGPPLFFPEFSLRSRREQPIRDVFNARKYEHWNTDVPSPQNNGPDALGGAAYNDMNPTNSRTVTKDYRQAQPYVVGSKSDALEKNPFFQKFDITQDPRNVARELQGAVYEYNPPRDQTVSQRLMSRNFDNRFEPAVQETKSFKAAIDIVSQFRPKLNDMKATYNRNVGPEPFRGSGAFSQN